MHLILTGATGLVGSAALDAMLRTADVTKISILSRRPVAMLEARSKPADPRVQVIIHSDFTSYPAPVLDQLRGADGCVWALGISQTQAPSHDEYVRITRDMALAAAEAFSSISAAGAAENPSPSTTGEEEAKKKKKKDFRFVYVAGGDTTQSPGMLTAFQAKVKGETEVELSKLMKRVNNNNDDDNTTTPAAAATATAATAARSRTLLASSVRPFYPDPWSHAAILPYIPTPSAVLRATETVLGPPIRHGFKNYWAPTEPFGEFLVEVAMGKYGDGGVGAGEKVPGGGPLMTGEGGILPVWLNSHMRKLKGW